MPKEFSQHPWLEGDTSTDNAFQSSFSPPFQAFPSGQLAFHNVEQVIREKKDPYKSTNPFLCSTEVNVQNSPVADIFAEFVAGDEGKTAIETSADTSSNESQQLLDKKHRRNISDTSVSSLIDKKRVSAFRYQNFIKLLFMSASVYLDFFNKN